MKRILAILALSASLAASPVLAFGIDLNTLFPTLTFPEPAPAPVTQANTGIGN